MARISSLNRFDLTDLARRLVRVASPSVFIAASACSGTTTTSGAVPLDGTGGAQSDAAGTGGAPATGGAPQQLPPLVSVDGGYPHCTGMATMLSGPCCVRVNCIEPPDGGRTCPASAALTARDLGYSGLGSGSCGCAPIVGPYSPASTRQYSETDGPCCYTIGIMGCTGRPLFVAGKPRLAPLVRGAGWA
jgi:hypothetical protein